MRKYFAINIKRNAFFPRWYAVPRTGDQTKKHVSVFTSAAGRNGNKKRTPCFIPQSVLELVTGLEPATCSLRMSCTTNCATQASLLSQQERVYYIILNLSRKTHAILCKFLLTFRNTITPNFQHLFLTIYLTVCHIVILSLSKAFYSHPILHLSTNFRQLPYRSQQVAKLVGFFYGF